MLKNELITSEGNYMNSFDEQSKSLKLKIDYCELSDLYKIEKSE